MAMTLRLNDEQTEALRQLAEAEGRSMQQVAVAAVEDYMTRNAHRVKVRRIAEDGAHRWADLLRRLGE